MKKLFILSLSVAFIILACSKEQQVVNKLEGSWKASSAKGTFMGFEFDMPLTDMNIIYTFYACKVKNGACDGVFQVDSLTDNFTYTIGGEGTTIDYVDSSGTAQSIEILDLEKETFKIQNDFGLDTTGNADVVVTFTRQ